MRVIPVVLFVLMLLAGYGKEAAAQGQKTGRFSEYSLFLKTDEWRDTAEMNKLITRGIALSGSAPDSAMSVLQHLLSVNKDAGYAEGVVACLSGIGRIYSNAGQYDKAMHHYKNAIPYCEQISGEKRARYFTNIYNSIGSAYQSQGDYKNAGAYYLKAVAKASGDSSLNRFRAYIYSNIGGIFIRLGQAGKAIYYFNHAEQLARSENDLKTLAHVLGNKGIYYEEKNDFDSSKLYYTEALKLSEQYNEEQVQLTTLSNLGALYMKQGQYAKAIPLFQKALKLSEKQNPYFRINGPLYFLGAAYYYLNDYKNAKRYLLLSLKEAGALRQTKMNMDVYSLLAMVHAATGDYREAYEYQKSYLHLKDSFAGGDATQVINALETKYRTAQKDKQIAQKQLKISRQQVNIQRKTKWIWTITACVLLLFILLVMLYLNFRHKQKLHREKLRTMQQEKEIELLQAMMQGEERERIRLAHELHDGISSQLSVMKAYLHAIRDQHNALAKGENFQQVMNILDDTACDLRKTAHNLLPDSLIRYGLVAATRHFCEQISGSENLNIEFQAYGDFDDLNDQFALSVYRIIQELLHNIIKHAQASETIILLNRQQDKLFLTVEDNGIGIQTVDQKTKGMGLRTLEDKIQSLNGFLSIESGPKKGAIVYIELPLIKKDKVIAHEDTY